MSSTRPSSLPPAPLPAASLRLVFEGECLPGFNAEEVRRAVAQALKLDDARAAKLFSGRRVVVRRDVNEATAVRYVARFAKMGAVLHVEPATASTPASAPLPPPLMPAPTPPGLQPLSWQPSRQVLMGSAGLVVVLLLALLVGPNLLDWWARTTPPWATAEAPEARVVAATAPPIAPVAAPPASVPALPVGTPAGPTAAAAFDDELPTDMGPQALRDYRQAYLPATGHKAFAIGGQAHAWQAGASSENDAREGALTRCMRVLRPGDSACRVVDANGQLTE